MPNHAKNVLALDVDKVARFSSRTCDAEKLYKTIGYILDAVGHVVAHLTQRETEFSHGLQAIASNISMARYVIRLTGGFESYAALKNGSWSYEDDTEHVRRLVRLQALSMMIYYPLEHIAYVGFVAPKLLHVDAMKFSRQSCQAWGVYILLDVYVNALRIRALTSKEKYIMRQQDLTDEKRSTELASIQAQYAEYFCLFSDIIGNQDVHCNYRRRELYYVQLRNFFYTGPCIHWSFEKDFLSDRLVSFLCTAEAIVGLWRSWANTK